MEWRGINLNNQYATLWLTQSLSSLATLIISLALGSIIALGMWQRAGNLQIKNRNLQQQVRQLEQNIKQTEQAISQLKNNNNTNDKTHLQAVEIHHFLQILRQLPLNGGLEFAQIEAESPAKIVLIGKVSSTVFSQLEQYLKQEQYHYQIEHLQNNETHGLAFNLSLWLKPKQETQ